MLSTPPSRNQQSVGNRPHTGNDQNSSNTITTEQTSYPKKNTNERINEMNAFHLTELCLFPTNLIAIAINPKINSDLIPQLNQNDETKR